MRPVGFSCSATLLDPVRARKGRLFNMMRKQMITSPVDSVPVIGSPASAPPHLAGEPMVGTPSDDMCSASVGTIATSPITLTHPEGGATSRPLATSIAPSDTSSAYSLGAAAPTRPRLSPSTTPASPNRNLVPFKMNRAALAKRSFASLTSKHHSGKAFADLPVSPPPHAAPSAYRHQPQSARLPSSTASGSAGPHAPPHGVHLAVHSSPNNRRRGASVGQVDAYDSSPSSYLNQHRHHADQCALPDDARPQVPKQSGTNVELYSQGASQRRRSRTGEEPNRRRPPTASEEVKAAYFAMQSRPATGSHVQSTVQAAALQAGWSRRPSTAQDASFAPKLMTRASQGNASMSSSTATDESRFAKQLPRLPSSDTPDISKRTSSSRLKALAPSKWTQHRQMSDDQSAQFLDSLHDQGFL